MPNLALQRKTLRIMRRVTSAGLKWAVQPALAILSCAATEPTSAQQPGLLAISQSVPLVLPAEHLRTNDIVLENLSCARELPGADHIEIQAAEKVLREWSSRVASETKRYMPKFRSSPAEYQNSESYFRILVMVTVLQQDFKVHYNPDRIEGPNFADSRDLFLHGILGEKRQGTCVSMPVLYVAVGRRLSYPLKLVTTKAHLFARWESPDGKEKLNIEATNQGLNCYPDDYYRNWPVPMTDEEVRRGHYLQSLRPQEELAVFLSARGHCLEANGRLPEAQLAQRYPVSQSFVR